ncbi:MAG: hypothetical protein GY782_01165 [Gammaproteobacteria bacterium]|nr:hypothetical protein [Gammaproteobacteria bacterium]
MVDEQPQPEKGQPPKQRKGCNISIMFPIDTDEEAMAVKKAIDAAIPDVEGKRYNFQITEI